MKRTISFILCLILMLGTMLTGCVENQPTETPDDSEQQNEQTPPAEDSTPDPEPEPEPEPERFRIIMSPDMHMTRLLDWNGLTTEDRAQMWIDSILEEHESDPIDLVVLQGDITLDHWAHGGNHIKDGSSDTEIFVDEYLSQLPDEIEVFVLPGNHEQYGEDDWYFITGNERQDYMVFGDHLILLIDTFADGLDPEEHHDGIYTGIDMEFVNEVVAEFPDKNIWIFTHFMHMPFESEEFKEFLRTNTNVRAVFHGHNHTLNVEDLGEEYNHVKLIMCGQFSYTGSGAVLDQYYSFRDLILQEDYATCSYIIPYRDMKIAGEYVEYVYETDVEFEY